MPRMLHKLSPKQVLAMSQPGRISDGGGLYLSISEGGRKRWVFLYVFRGRQREMGLGSAGRHGVSLAEARQRARDARAVLTSGEDPLEAKEARRRVEQPSVVPTFGEFADQYVATMRPSWHNERHAQQWETTLRVHAASLRPKHLDEIDTADVMAVLQPIWTETPETAQRLRGRIEAVLDAAKSKGHRQGENPARWRGHLAHLLPKRRKLTRGHHRALPYEDVPHLMKALQAQTSTLARLVEFTILTATRSNEARGLRWEELDLDRAVWTIPAARMKARREHRVPLCGRALQILQEMKGLATGQLVFASRGGGKFSDMAPAQLLRRLGYGDRTTLHGFRASFRTWASDKTSFPHDVCEAVLAHVIRDQTVVAYQRGDLFERRRQVMDAWEEFVVDSCTEVRTRRAA